MESHTQAEIEGASDETLTDWLVELLRVAKSHDKWDRRYAQDLGREMAKRPGTRDLIGSLKGW